MGRAADRDTPPIIIALLKRCLQKDPHDRLHDIADARIEIGEAIAVQSGPTRAMYTAPEKPKLTGPVLALASSFLAGALLASWWFTRSPEPSPVLRLGIELPAAAPLALGSGPSLALAPDGSRFVYAARRGETTELYERTLGQVAPVPLAGTEGATDPFFSTDGAWLGFFAAGELKKVGGASGSPVLVAESPAPRGAAWGTAERIVFAPNAAGGLSSVGSSGGDLEILTEIDPATDEKSHRWPSLLPGGEALVFTVWSEGRFDVDALSLSSGERKTVVEDGSDARYVPTGHLVFARGTDLFAVRFDPGRLRTSGPEVRVAENVGVDALTGAAFFSFDRNGTLIYAPGRNRVHDDNVGSLLSVDREGVVTRLTETERAFQLPRVSPDERSLIVTIDDDDKTDLWVRDLERGATTRLTFRGNNGGGIWSPDQERVAFSSDRDGVFNVYWKPSDGSGDAARLTTSDFPQMPTSWSPDGGAIVYTELDPSNGFDVWILHLADGRREGLVQTSFNDIGGVFSPDGSLLAYVSDESGENEIYVRSYPEGRRWQVSVGGGTEPVWSPDGLELFYRDREWISSSRIETEPSFAASKPRLLFETPYAPGESAYPNFDVTSDGRFIMIQSNLESATTSLRVVMHWFEDLRSLAPAR